MAIYTFYPCKADGSSTTFEAYDLVSDPAAADRAAILLHRHPSADYVAVWLADRKILTLDRDGNLD